MLCFALHLVQSLGLRFLGCDQMLGLSIQLVLPGGFLPRDEKNFDSTEFSAGRLDAQPLLLFVSVNLILINERDTKEWDRVFPELYGPALQKIRSLNKAICKGQLSLETIEDLATEAVILAFQNAVQFKSVRHVIGHVVEVAKFRTMTFAKSAYGWRSIDHRFASLDAQPGDETDQRPPPQPEDTAPAGPDKLTLKAELIAIAEQVLTQAKPEDREVLNERFIQGLLEREVGARRDWPVNEVHSRIKQACGRVKKLLKSDPQFAKLSKELESEHYFDE